MRIFSAQMEVTENQCGTKKILNPCCDNCRWQWSCHAICFPLFHEFPSNHPPWACRRPAQFLCGSSAAAHPARRHRRSGAAWPLRAHLPAAHAAQLVLGKNNPIHPTRVRKAGLPTHIIPGWLRDHGFPFRFSFQDSLAHWREVAPQDFA